MINLSSNYSCSGGDIIRTPDWVQQERCSNEFVVRVNVVGLRSFCAWVPDLGLPVIIFGIILQLGGALVLFFARERRSVWLFVFLVQPSFAFFEQYQSLPANSEVHRPSRTNDQLANYAIMLTPLRGRPPEKNGMPLSVFRKSGHAIACGHDLRVR